MSDVVISIENLSKRYLVGHNTTNAEHSPDFRELISRKVSRFARKTRDMLSGSPLVQGDAVEEFWALNDVSFEVRQGERLGIIGRNGAGKSTLLKILSRITEPTKGRVRIAGRVASLLEVGTGFHPELSGRENIYLNGAMLGMSRTEVHRKFDEIVAFAEVERFLDTPVKRYSSGMYVRLAFAVAAHLEPEILIVDEVLAVGDAQFQRKCMGKMESIGNEGRTVIFVSHNIAAITALCTNAVLLNQGALTTGGATADVVRQYIAMGQEQTGAVIWATQSSAPGNSNIRLHAVRTISNGTVSGEIEIDQDLQIEIEFWNLNSGAEITVSIHLTNDMGVTVLASGNMHSANRIRDDWYGKPFEIGLYRSVCTVPGNFLNVGRYAINVIVLTNVTNPQVYEKEILCFSIHETGEMCKEFNGVWIGVVRPKLAWSTKMIGE